MAAIKIRGGLAGGRMHGGNTQEVQGYLIFLAAPGRA
jgi:hypothetical protein